MRKLIILSGFGLLIILMACSKAKSRKWLVGDVTIKDAVTGEPIQASVYLTYHESSFISQGDDVKVGIGSLDENGNIKFERRISKNETGFSLNIHAVGSYLEPYVKQIGTPDKIIKLDVKSKNELIIYLNPLYPFLLNTSNVNCLGPTDTLWVTVEGYMDTIVGCADSYVPGKYGGYSGSIQITDCVASPNLTVQIRTKKSGIENIYSQNFTLLPAETTFLLLNY